MYEYKKKWYTFGIIDSIYYSKNLGFIIVFTDKTTKLLHTCNVNDFIYNVDKKAFLKGIEANNITILNDTNYVIYGDI
jgi:hypothetical protein